MTGSIIYSGVWGNLQTLQFISLTQIAKSSGKRTYSPNQSPYDLDPNRVWRGYVS